MKISGDKTEKICEANKAAQPKTEKKKKKIDKRIYNVVMLRKTNGEYVHDTGNIM